MITARDIMTTEVISATPDMKVAEAASLMLDQHINGLPVVDPEGRVVGIICQSDLVAQQKRVPLPSVFNLLDSLIPLTSPAKLEKEMKKIAASRVADAMTSNPITVSPEMSLEDVATLMVNKNFHTLPVVEGGKLVGVIGKEDVLRTLLADRFK